MFSEWFNETRLRLRTIFKRKQLARDLDDELAFHISMSEERNRRAGIDSKEAPYAAQRQFGNATSFKERMREMWTFVSFETLWQDIRFAARKMIKSPGFTAATVLTIALGIGANSAIFSIVDAILLKPLPYHEPEELVSVSESNSPNDLASRSAVAPGNFLDWRAQNHAFAQMIAVKLPGFSLTGTDRPMRVLGAAVSANTLNILGLSPQLGRDFSPDDDRADADRVLLLTDSLWRRRLNADPSIIGKSIHLGTVAYTVVGILPPSLQFPQPDVDLWVPLERDTTSSDMHWRNSHYLDVYGRLKPGVTLAQAREDINNIAASLKQTYPDTNSGAGALVLPLQDDLVRGIRPALLTLLVAVGLVLLIACANVANLLLVHAVGREKEMSVRLALGAGSFRLVRQLLTESILLSLAGALGGLLVATWTRQALLALRPADLQRYNAIQTDSRMLLFTLVVSILTGILFGLVPALRTTRSQVNHLSHGFSRNATSSASSHRLRSLLVAGEVAISLVLLIGAGLLIRTFTHLLNTDLGFRTDNILTMRISIPTEEYTQDSQVTSFYDHILGKVRSLPGVESAGLVSFLPLTGQNFDNSFDIVGRPPYPPSNREYPLVRFVDTQYLNVLGIPLLHGRGFTEHDHAAAPRVVLVSESLVRRYWRNANPLGEHLVVYMGQDQSPWEIVGVVRDVRSNISAEPQPTIYFPYAQMPYRFMVLAVRTHSDTKDMVENIRNAASSVDPDQPLYQVRTLDELLALTLVPWRFSMSVLSAFAALALLLASAGIYGVVFYTVSQRTRELGIRIALGAQSREILRLVLWQGSATVLIGIAVGISVALYFTRFLTSQLYGVTSTDPETFLGVAFLFLAVASLATWIPARLATRVDPVVALRYE